MRIWIPAVPLALCATTANAHPGEHHGGWLAAITHLLSEPDHLAMALVAVAAGAVCARLVRRRASAGRPSGHRRSGRFQ